MATEAIPSGRRGYDTVIFDCDSTLTAVEGIDELARLRGRYREVASLTDAAMNGELPLDDVYARRLEMLTPSRREVAAIADRYRRHAVPDAAAVIGALHESGKDVFIVSGGLLDAVGPFGAWLGVSGDHIRAVGIRYTPDSAGVDRYEDTEPTPLTGANGKSIVVRELLRGRPGRSLLVGDGASDLVAAESVTCFVGFTGVVERPSIVAAADVLITGPALSPLLGLALTASEEEELDGTSHHSLIDDGRTRIDGGELIFRGGTTS
jgi:phosphoserine phosphatase